MTENKNLTPPSLLSFEAKLLCSDATMMSANWNDIGDDTKWKPVKIEEKSVRGTISNRDEKSNTEHNDHAKFLKEIANPNIQTVDNAALPDDSDTLKVSFTLRVLGNLANPTACNDAGYKKVLTSLINKYVDETTLSKLSYRYAKNIANGRFLWRNRVGAESVEVHVTVKGEESPLKFNAYEIGMKDFSAPVEDKYKKKLKKLADIIQEGLEDKTGEYFSFIRVDAYSKLGNCQQVFPSQEMVMEKGDKSKFLFKLKKGNKDEEIAAMHSQKIGNAIRTIDDWHSQSTTVGAIAVEPYGSVTNHGDAYRPQNNGSFYKLLDDWIKNDKPPKSDEQDYIMAVFIRGGVFSKAKQDKKTK